MMYGLEGFSAYGFSILYFMSIGKKIGEASIILLFNFEFIIDSN